MIPFLDLKAVNDRFGDQISRAINRVTDSGVYIGGPELDRFENLMKKITGAPEVVPVANGTDALTLILEGLITLGQLKPGDQIIIPANTYIASFMAVWRAGLRPVPVDADPLTMNIDFSKIEDSISPATKAIMTVHLYGLIAFDPILIDLKNRYGLVIIEDCAQAIGAKSIIKGVCSNVAGGLGDVAAFSFYPTKNIGALGDSGAVVTGNTQLAKTIRALANYGSDRRYHNIYKGVNSRLDAMQAAVLNVKLPCIDEITMRRIRRAEKYCHLINNPLITLPCSPGSGQHVYHQFVIRTQDRDILRRFLYDNGIETDCHYNVAAIDQPCCSGEFKGDFNVTRQIAATCVSLPIGDHLSDGQIGTIADAINAFSGSGPIN